MMAWRERTGIRQPLDHLIERIDQRQRGRARNMAVVHPQNLRQPTKPEFVAHATDPEVADVSGRHTRLDVGNCELSSSITTSISRRV